MRVAQHPLKCLCGDGTSGGRVGQTSGGQASVQRVDGVVVGGEQLKGLRNEMAPVAAGFDGVDPPALGVLDHVAVAELGATVGAPVLDLLEHLRGDVLAVEIDLLPVQVCAGVAAGHGAAPVSSMRATRAYTTAISEPPLRPRSGGTTSPQPLR